MVVFDYKELGWSLKYAKEIFYGILLLVAVATVIVLLVNFFKRSRGCFVKILVFILTVAAAVAISYFAHKNYLAKCDKLEAIEKYKEREENGELVSVSGTVESFASYSDRKVFNLGGEEFVIYEINDYKKPEGDVEVNVHYMYIAAYSTVNTGTNYTNTVYHPESCVISANLKLEIRYIEEFGEKRILYIKELTE